MAQLQSLLLAFLFVVGSFYFYTALGEEEFGTEIRTKRDVLKGKNHDLVRSKRYIGRVPVAYMKKVNLQPYEEDNLASGNSKPASHFREMLQTHQGTPTGGEEIRPIPGGMTKTHHNSRRYVPNLPRESDDNDSTANLTNEEIQTLLLMLDGYDLNKNYPPRGRSIRPEQYYSVLPPLNLDRAAQMYEVGKRETGKRSLRNYEEPMSFDNSVFSGYRDDKLEFLNGGRNKRTGARHMVTSRVKKETDPTVLANLDRVFSDDAKLKEKSKKAIDWSNYFGVDKRANDKEEKPKVPVIASHQPPQPTSTLATNSNPKPAPTNSIIKSKLVPVPLSSSSTPTNKSDKKEQQRKENETEDKQVADREWILHEFYKNFAMMTNVKRKREIPSIAEPNELDRLQQLEKQMTQFGDKIIWDALKYTGAHRDSDMSPKELAKVKADIIEKLSTAYSLEKLREAMEDMRQKIEALKKTQI